MVGFDDKALVLFPKIDIYETNNLKYRAQWQTAVINLLAFLKQKFYVPHALVTDDMAKILPSLKFQYVSTLSPGDLFFLSRNADNCGNIMHMDLIQFPDSYAAAEKKYPMPAEVTVEERFDIVCKRDKMAAQSIIPQYKVVFYFYKKGYTNYKVASKPDDGKMRIAIDANTFIPTVYLSGTEQDPIDVLGSAFANRSLVNWEV